MQEVLRSLHCWQVKLKLSNAGVRLRLYAVYYEYAL
jgi:hypothetical protein